MTIQGWRAWWGLLALLPLLAGCAAPPYAQDEAVVGLVQAYRQQSARVRSVSPQGISVLTVEPVASRPGQFLVTASLERAPLASVVRRLLEDTSTPHLILSQPLLGRVTARFEKHPFREALRQLLGAQGYVATERDGLLVITDAEPPPAPGTGPPGPGSEAPAAPWLSRGVPLRHLDMDTATKFLEGLFPVDQRTGARPIAWASQPYTSTVFVSGPGPDVSRALRLLDEMDRDPSHVLIEVLIVELDTNELERVGTDLANFVNRQYSTLASGVGGTNVLPGMGAAPAALSFLYQRGANGRLQFNAIIEVLAAQDKARTIARPYMATLSGRQARIEIGRTRTVAVVSGVDQVVSDTKDVPSGVMLTITPWVLEDERVRLDVVVEQSVFIEPAPNTGILVETDANKATATMQVRSGQSMIIGGLALQETSSANAGLPWLRNIPLLNVLAAKQQGAERKQDVVVFVTPYVWVPAVDPPFPHPDAFKFRDEDETTAIEAWKRRWIKP